MAHCEAPACGLRAGEMAVQTPMGVPVVCDEHALHLLAAFGEGARMSVGVALKVMWVEPTMRFGPADHVSRVAWLEGRPSPLELRATLERVA